MGIRCNGNTANYLARSSGVLDFNNPYVIAGWLYLVAVPGVGTNANIFVVSNATSTAYDVVGVNSSGQLYAVAANGSFPAASTGTTLSTATWYHVALVRSGAGLQVFLDGVLDITDNRSIAARAASDRMYIGVWQSGGFGVSDPLDGRVARLKAWGVALSAAELINEARTVLPRRIANLYAYWPARPGSAERVKDYSGNSRDWTATGTLTDEDDPPIGWGAVPGQRVRPVTMYSQALDGSLTPAGAVVRQTKKVLAGGLTPSGGLVRQAKKILAGTLTPDGVVVRQTKKVLAGGLTPSGVVIRQAKKLLAGTLTSSGAISTIKLLFRALGGTLTSSGGLVRKPTKALSGTLTSSGVLVRQPKKLLAGTLTSSGGLVRQAKKILAGELTPAGTLSTLKRYIAPLLDRLFRLIGRRRAFFLTDVRSFSVPAARRQFEAHRMAVAEVPKDPQEVIDYGFDYTTLLDGDTIASSSWSASGVTVDSSSNTTTTTAVRITGGTLGTKNKVKNTVITAGGQTIVRRLIVVIQEM